MALESYVPNQWAPQTPITQDRMEHLEEGVRVNRENLSNTMNTVDQHTSQINQRPTTTQVTALVEQGSGQGAWARTEIITAMEGDTYTSLKNRFDADEQKIADIKAILGTKNMDGKTVDAYDSKNTIYNNVNDIKTNVDLALAEIRAARTSGISNITYDSLYQHLLNMDSAIDILQANVTAINAAAGQDAQGNNLTLAARIRQLQAIQDEINAAHRAVASNEDPDTLLKRFIAIETLLSQHTTTLSNLTDTKVSKEDVINDFTHTDTDKPLSANKGKELRDIIGGNYNSSSTVTNAIATAQSTAESNSEAYTNSLLGDGFDTVNTVAAAIEALENTDAETDERLSNIEVEITAAHRDLGTDPETEEVIIDSLNKRFIDAETLIAALRTEINNAYASAAMDNTTYDSLDARLEAIETYALAVRTDINTIASELAMVDNDSIIDTNTRVDILENDLRTMAAELNMLDGTAIRDTNTRVDVIENEIDAAHRTSDDTLDARFDDLEAVISHVADSEDPEDKGGLVERLTAVEVLASGANVTANAAATKTALNTLTERVANLENSTVIVPESHIDYNLETGLPTVYTDDSKTITITPVATAEYLLQKSDKYYYWKYIEGEWQLISGGGSGTGNTSGMNISAAEYVALEIHSENTDYYVTRTDGIHHYRWINIEDIETGLKVLTEIEIGQFIDTSKIKRYNIAAETATVEGEEVTYLNLYQYDYDELNNDIDTERAPLTQIILPKGGGSGSSTGSINKLTRIGDQTIQKIIGSQILLRVFYSSWDNSGAESSSGDYVLKTGNTVISSGVFNSGANDADLTLGWQENTPGYYEFDVTNYCNIGNTTFTLTVSVNGTSLGKSWTANVVDLHLESDAPEVLLIDSANSYEFPYTAFGALSKTLHVIVDDNTATETIVNLSSVTSGRVATVSIPAQTHGAHKIELYLTATVGGVAQTTPSIIREYIWYNVNDESFPLILASPYNEQTITAQQYSTVEIPYQVYKKNATTIIVDYYADDVLFDSVTLEDTNIGTLSYLAATEGAHTLKIMVDNDVTTALIINLVITELDINVSPVAGAIIDFDPIMLTNSSTGRLPSWTVGSNTYKLTASENFNWSEDVSGGGYKTEDDGKAFVIKAGSYIDLDYPMFAGNGSNNILTNGAEMKIIFKTKAVRDINAIWFQNTGTLTGKTVGIQLGAHSGWLKTDKASDITSSADTSEYNAWVSGAEYTVDSLVLYKDTIYKCIANVPSADAATNPKDASTYWLSMGKIDTEVLATNSYLYFPYSEEDKIELDININKYSTNSDTNFIMSYEDGVPSKAYAYEYGAAGDGLYHSNTIRIGSPDCDVYIYRLRIYNQSLDTDDILQNFIADGNGISEKVERYNRNCIYWDSTQEKYFTSPSSTAVLDPLKLAEVMPDVKVLMLDTPVFTTGKKNFVQGSSLRCIHAEGGNVYKSRGDADNWLFTNGFHSGQGTTSDNYGQAGRNVDFLFEVDGVHYPTKKKNMGGYTPSTDYTSKVYIGENASEWNGTTWVPTRDAEEIETCDDWKGDKCKVSLTETSVPNNYFNLKVNIASSENVNNALFQKRYNDFLVYNSPAQTAQIRKHRAAYTALGQNPNNIKVKNSMEFVPAVLFVRENDPDISKHTEFKDTNYHFYALGNIGDSKKTDYTRAYDPDDMNEFTCEDSDNNTNNGQFQSGVFMYNGVRAIETPYAAYDSTKTYAANDVVVNNGVIQVYNGSTWSNATLTGWTDAAAPYFAPYTAPNTMQYLYPITSSEWNVQVNSGYVNYKHYTLITEEFDGDHSFEFRYACRGDYRDGDLINESEGQDDNTQFELNHGVMLAMYEWLLTATEEQYASEAPQWFVKSAMEFFYAYTHYYTLMDNRAKNTFWHFAKTGTHLQVSRPVAALLHIYDELIDGEYVRTSDVAIDPSKTYYTEYAFDLHVYDTDTCCGIDNNGALVFPYGKEDTDYRTEGDPSSGYAFNGAGSIFWRRLRETFASEIVDVMTSTDANCFNSEDLINELDTFQNCYPEEIWRLDIERKYIRTFTGASIDNSVTTGKQNPRFLTSMMQGRKKYQRRQWVRDQGVYFNSKYRLSDITANGNTIEFNCTTPADTANIAVTPSYYLQLTPYQDMYLNVQVGNGNYKDSYITADGSKSLRAKAGQTYTFDLSGNYQETRIYINGANHLSAIGNLAPMYPYSFDLRALAHIKTLDIGTDVASYTNTKFTELKLPTFMPLLESLNIKNCHSIAGTISLATASNIRAVEAMGTSVTGISLPDYTSIETLHIPSTVTAVNLYGARRLTDFKVFNSAEINDYSSLYKLHIYDSDYSSSVDWMNIASAILTKKSLETELSLLKLNVATINNIQDMEPYSEFKETLENAGGVLDFTGTIHVTGDYSDVEKETYENTWPGLTLDVTSGTLKPKYKVTYKYDDYIDNNGNTVPGEVIKVLYISRGDPVVDIWQYTDQDTQEIVHILDEMPSRESTVRKSYQFGLRSYGSYLENSGWRQDGQNAPMSTMGIPAVTSNMTIYTYFKEDDATYDIKWYLRRNNDGTPRASTLVKTSANPVKYGGGADEEAPTVKEIHDAGLETCSVEINGGQVSYSIFKGWEKLPVNINPIMANEPYCIYAEWEEASMALVDLFANVDNLTPAQLLVLSALDANGRANYSNDAAAIGSQVTYTLGQDNIDSGTELIGPNASRKILRLDLQTTSVLNTSIQPLSSANDEFTIAIDYCLNKDAVYNSQYRAGIIASCYAVNSTANTVTGFALYNNLYSSLNETGPRVGYGDMFSQSSQSVAVGSATNIGSRNIVVLRHPKGSSILYVYSSLNSSGTISPTVIAQQIPWNNSTSEAYLVFGQVTNSIASDYTSIKSITTRAQSTVYWAKYWPSDLGVGECKRIAAWPHENVSFAFSTIESYATSGDRTIGGAPTPALGLTSISTSTHGQIIHSTADTAIGSATGWGTSNMRNICNGTLIEGLPIQLQSILCKTNTAYYNMMPTVENSMTFQHLASVPSYVRDYIAVPSARSLGDPNTTMDYDAEENNNNLEPYTWLADNTSVLVYNYNPNVSGRWEAASDSDRAYYLNLRFPGYDLTWSSVAPLRIFRIRSISISSSSTIYAEINNISGGIRVGDIFISADGNAYVYISDTNITVDGMQNELNSGIFSTESGGWLQASEYWTRSMGYGQSRNNFVYVDTAGALNLSETRSANQMGLSLNYTIAI